MKYTALLLTLILTSAQANLTSSSYETAGYIELIIVAIFVGFVFAYPHIKRIYTRKKINVNEIKLIDDIECPGIFFKIINDNETHWGLIQEDKQDGSCDVVFVNDQSVVLDKLEFEYWHQAKTELEHNGFVAAEYNADRRKTFNLSTPPSSPPSAPYSNNQNANFIYSSGEYWELPELVTIKIYDSWVKATCFEFLTLVWAIIEHQKNDNYKVFFVSSEDNYIYEEKEFNTLEEVESLLSKEEYERYESITQEDDKVRHGYNKRLHDMAMGVGIGFPEQPFKRDTYSKEWNKNTD